ncbi:MAG: hypothetical protein DSY92_05490, partial [Planctomycetota bacterium]
MSHFKLLLFLCCISSATASSKPLQAEEGWVPVPVPGRWETSFGKYDGTGWLKAYLILPADWAGKDLVLHAGHPPAAGRGGRI